MRSTPAIRASCRTRAPATTRSRSYGRRSNAVGGRYDERLVFRDAEVSGGSWQRDGLQALLVAVESGRVRRVFVEDVSRLSRDKEDAARLEKTFDYHASRSSRWTA